MNTGSAERSGSRRMSAGGPISAMELRRWLDAYGAAWEARDGAAAARLFSKAATYHWGPFETLNGRSAIARRWAAATSDQEGIRFEHSPLGAAEGRSFVRWRATFLRLSSRERQELDGIFVLCFAADGTCMELSEWWRERVPRTRDFPAASVGAALPGSAITSDENGEAHGRAMFDV